jgi:hypothetical protein
MSLKAVSFSALFFLVFMASVNAMSIVITPIQGSTTTIPPGACGSSGSLPFTIQNTGGGGVLCWYTTSDSAIPQKLTSACIRPDQTSTYSASVLLPVTSGTKTVSVQLDCFDFYSAFTDKCVDTYDYAQARANMYSEAKQDTNPAIAPRSASVSCTAIQFSVTPPTQAISLYTGQSKTLSYQVANPTTGSITCSYSGSLGQGPLGAIPAGSSQSFSVTVQASSSGAASQTLNGQVTCTDSLQQSGTQSFSVSVTTSQDPAVSAINSAQTAINSANTQLLTTEQTIQAQTALGVDTSGSTGLLQQAKSLVQQATTALTSATSSRTNGDSTSAKNSADQATAYAQQALSSNGQILSTLEDEKKDFAEGAKEASDLISQAKDKIAESQSWIERAETMVANATSLGMDTVSAKTKVASAKSTLLNANSYLTQATSSFTSKNYALSKTNANGAIQNADSAKTSASTAYDSLSDTVQKVSIASELMKKANTNIQKADQTYIKLTGVVRETRKYTNVSDVESDIAAQKAVIDQAKDAASQAQNRFQQGTYADAVDYATRAQDLADSAKNRLDRIVEKLTNNIQDALAKSLEDANANINASTTAIQSAASTYGASSDKIASAQQNLTQAQIQFQTATTAVNEVKSAVGLTTFLDKAASAFEQIQTTATLSAQAKSDADAARNDALTKVGAGVAGVVGAGGVGFMWWRRRKKEPKKSESTKGTHEKSAETQAAPAKVVHAKAEETKTHCKKCSKPLSHDAKFCHHCGAKTSHHQ